MTTTILRLCGQHTELQLRHRPTAELLYWGRKLAHFDRAAADTLVRAVPNSRLDVDVPLGLNPEAGRGVFSAPGVEGHRQGMDWSPVFEPVSVSHQGQQARLIYEDAIAGLRLEMEIGLDPDSEVLALRHTLTNLKAGDYELSRLALTLQLPERVSELQAFHGRWCKEFQSHRLPLVHGGYLQENRRGRSSHEYFPGFMLGTPGFGEQQGEVWGFHLAWSGNHRLRADVKSDGRRFVQAEALYAPGEIRLAEGESCSTPWLYASYSDAGLTGMSRQFHCFVRAHILNWPVAKSRPVHLNTWEGIYFDHSPAYIMEMASRAAEMGVERFIIDDGWFRGRDHDRAALGDWYLDERKYPEGLEPVIAHVKALGMEFGIWFEPEMINPDSDLYRAHPDWLLALPGYRQPAGRFQYVLDLQNPEVFGYLLARFDELLGRYHIDYVKWDMNRELVQPGHEGRPAQHGQTLAVYRLLDELERRHPRVEFESCASGGGRVDYEILKRAHRFWPSDNNDALDRQQIQRGMSYFFPPEVMGTHIGTHHSHSTRRELDIAFRGLTALFGHMGVELDPVKESEAERQGFARYIALHKQLRPLLHGGEVVRLDSPDPAQLIHGVVSPDRSEAVFYVGQLTLPRYALSGALRLPGLAADKRYRVELLERPACFDYGVMKKLPLWVDGGCVAGGDWLAEAGLAMPVLDPQSAMVIKLTAL
ncbi:alpha-galactosidase [Zobellella iuensis]|uniref:Alpha-galactosidase n=1 Tax=Zobellella iuensis TaxID=2803811 RepID=A0ABS1QNR3_9GAMM|nr:alpha-galactosidase [Zobellella iuensis]MBL1375929.1 alpha-galactosidase [Zobellella iuensis]